MNVKRIVRCVYSEPATVSVLDCASKNTSIKKKNKFFEGACALKCSNTLIFYGENIAVSLNCAEHDHTSFKVHGREEDNSNPEK